MHPRHVAKKARHKTTTRKRTTKPHTDTPPKTFKALKHRLTPRTQRGRKILTYSLVGVSAWVGLSYFLGAA